MLATDGLASLASQLSAKNDAEANYAAALAALTTTIGGVTFSITAAGLVVNPLASAYAFTAAQAAELALYLTEWYPDECELVGVTYEEPEPPE